MRLVLVLGLLLPLQATAAVLTADLQPYGVCTATGCGDPSFDTGIFAKTWRQAGIVFDILPPRRTGTLAAAEARPGQLQADDTLGAFRGSVAQVRPNTVYVGFSTPLDGVYGMAYRNTPQSRHYPFAVVESGLPPHVAGLVAAHEVGHVLGAPHVTGPTGENLMRLDLPALSYAEPSFLPGILPETRSIVRSSPLLAPVPAPSSLALGLSVLVLAAGIRWRRHRATGAT